MTTTTESQITSGKADNQRWKAYTRWRDMHARCHPDYKYPSYRGCTVHPSFLTFEGYLQWATAQIGFYEPRFQLDKDCLKKGNREYGPDTCVFLPWEINQVFLSAKAKRGDLPIGVVVGKTRYESFCRLNKIQTRLGSFDTAEEAFAAYKVAKEGEIRRLADKWRDKINPKAYQALMSYQIEITD